MEVQTFTVPVDASELDDHLAELDFAGETLRMGCSVQRYDNGMGCGVVVVTAQDGQFKAFHYE